MWVRLWRCPDGRAGRSLVEVFVRVQDRFYLENMFDGQRYRSCQSPSICADALGRPSFRLGPDPVGYCQQEVSAALPPSLHPTRRCEIISQKQLFQA